MLETPDSPHALIGGHVRQAVRTLRTARDRLCPTQPHHGAETVFANEIRRAAEAAARVELPAVSAALWKAFGVGQISEAEAEELSALIEARRTVSVASEAPPRRVGSRPRSPASLERRRRWAASGRLPPALATRFTLGEAAALAVIASEVAKRGDCRLAIGHIAAMAGVSETSVRRALRAARDLALLTVEQRRLTGFRNDTNVVRIVSIEWTAWLRLARRGEGVGANLGGARIPKVLEGQAKRASEASQRLPGPADRLPLGDISGSRWRSKNAVPNR